MRFYNLIFWSLGVAVLVFSCSTLAPLLQNAQMVKPTARVSNVEISGLSFKKVDLLFDIEVKNPNKLGIKLNGFDYRLDLNENPFLEGKQENQLEIKANDSSALHLPLSLAFMDVYDTFNSLRSRDSSVYELEMGFMFNVPLLGSIRVPVRQSGTVPLIQFPSLSLRAIKLQKINLSGANLKLEVKVDNLNKMPLNFSKFNYHLDINGSNWISGLVEEQKQIGSSGEQILEIPFSLNFLSMGSTVYNLLRGDSDLQYNLKGTVNLLPIGASSAETLMPFNYSGSVTVLK